VCGTARVGGGRATGGGIEPEGATLQAEREKREEREEREREREREIHFDTIPLRGHVTLP
jgi:hypothetical protein